MTGIGLQVYLINLYRSRIMITMRRSALALLCIILSGMAVHAQATRFGGDNPVMPLGSGNAGRDFWLAFPHNWDLPGSTFYMVHLYITSDVRTQVRIWAGAELKKVIYTIPDKIVTVELTPQEAQMFVRNDAPQVPPDRAYRKKAVHVQSDAPIIVYGMNHTTYTSEGLLALPTNVLGREYIIASYGAVIGVSQELPSQYMVIAPYNGTVVSIYHPHRTPNHAAGESFTVELDSGDVWSAMTVGYAGDMSGAIIRSNKPIAVIAGQQCAYIPNLLNFCCCDHIVETMLPTSAWGKTYHAVPFETRQKGSFFRIFAKEPNTKLSINGVPYSTLSTVGGEEGFGWLEYRALGKDVVEFSADKPIYVAQYNPSQYYDNVPSDPFYLMLTPVEQYHNRLTFSTPGEGFRKNFLNLVCDEDGYQQIEITVAGENQWEPLWKMEGVGVPKKFPSKINGKEYLGVSIDMKLGVYQMRGPSPFGGHLYGFSSFTSYGYPLSVSTSDLSGTDGESPVLSKIQDGNGTVQASVSDKPEDAAIRTNLATIELDMSATENYELAVTRFEPGISQTTSYTLTVIDLSKAAHAVVIISDMAGNVTMDTAQYTPSGGLISLRSRVDFGKVQADGRTQRSVRLINIGSTPATVDELSLKSGMQGFTIVSPMGGVVIGSKDSLDVVVEFTASLGGRTEGLVVYEDSVGIRDGSGIRYVTGVRGQVVKPMIEVADHDFGSVPVGTESAMWQMEVQNISKIEGSTLIVFSKSGPSSPSTFGVAGSLAEPLFVLEPGESRTLTIIARPAEEKEYRDTIFFSSNAMDAGSADTICLLQVTGTKPASVGLTGAEMMIRGVEVLPTPIDRDDATLWYSLRRAGLVRVVLIDGVGREMRELSSIRYEEAGDRSLRLDLSGVAAGSYLVRIESDGASVVQRVVVVR